MLNEYLFQEVSIERINGSVFVGKLIYATEKKIIVEANGVDYWFITSTVKDVKLLK